MFTAAVPKAAVNKNSELRLGEYEVGAPVQAMITSPSSDSIRTQNLHQATFGGFIAF
jgi:hypothetical protein